MRPSTLAEAVERIRAGEPRDEMLAEFVDSFLLAPTRAARYATIEREPARTGRRPAERTGRRDGRISGEAVSACRACRNGLPSRGGVSTSRGSRPPRPIPRCANTWPSRARPNSARATSSPKSVRCAAREVILPLARAGASGMIIAIDGPAASGKGTLGKRLAAHFGLRHLDTGLIYRAVAKALLDAGHPLDDRDRARRGRARARSRAVRRKDAERPRDRRGRLDRLGDPARCAARCSRSSVISPQRRPARCSTGATSARSSVPTPT